MFFTAETARAGAAVIPACTHHTDGTSVWRTDKFQEGLVKMQGWNFSWERRQMTDDYMAWTRWHLLSLQSDITIFTSWRHSALFLLQRTITKQNCIAMRVTQTLALYKALQRAWIKYKNEGKKNKKKERIHGYERERAIAQSGLICSTADLLKEGAPEGQTDGVNKTAQICKSPKIDVMSISPTCHHIRYVSTNPVRMHS